jgi:mycofactocin precursor
MCEGVNDNLQGEVLMAVDEADVAELETDDPLAEAPAAEPLVEVELLVEDISIDGMCGVY